MTTNTEQKPQQTSKDLPVPQAGEPPYTFRAAWAIFLVAVNFLVAAIYFHIFDL